MKSPNLIKNALLSEKAYDQMKKGTYMFFVDRKATKEQIAQIVKDQFSVEVEKVNVLSVKPKTKRAPRTRKSFSTGGGKKAIVYLKSGQSIDMLLPKSLSKKANKKSEKKEDKKQKKETKGDK